jgi:hypothetical protein
LYKDNRHQKCSPYIEHAAAYCNPRKLDFTKRIVRLPNSFTAPPSPSPERHHRCHRSTTVTVTRGPLIRAQRSTLRPAPLPELHCRHRPHVGPPSRIARCHLHHRPGRSGLPPPIARPSNPAIHTALAPGASNHSLVPHPAPPPSPTLLPSAHRCSLLYFPPLPIAAPDPGASLSHCCLLELLLHPRCLPELPLPPRELVKCSPHCPIRWRVVPSCFVVLLHGIII